MALLTIFLSSLLIPRNTVGVSAFSSCEYHSDARRSGCHSRKPPRACAAGAALRNNDSGGGDATRAASFDGVPVLIAPTTVPDPSPKLDKVDHATRTDDDAAERVNSATLQFNNRLSRMAKNLDADTAPKVEALLLEAVRKFQEHEDENDDVGKVRRSMVIPNTISFTNAITAWARCTRKDAARRAEALLDEMHSLHEGRGWVRVRPNRISYNSAITAWARSRERGGGRRAEELLRRMYEHHDSESGSTGYGDDLKPDSRSWNAVINVVARSREQGCADRARSLLDEMERLYEGGDTDLLPDALAFGAVINAYANSQEEGASDKAAQLLMHMESLHQLGFENARPTTFVYNACMNAFAKDPLISSLNVTDGGGKSTLTRADKAEQLLTSMEKRYEDEGDGSIAPDCISYSTVINAHANCGSALSGARADAVLRRMTCRYLMGEERCRPNAVAYTAAIKAHSAAINTATSAGDRRSAEASARRCEDLLQQLCLLHQNWGGDRSMRPTAVTFELAISALERVGDEDGAGRGRLLRDKMMARSDARG